MRRPFRLPSGIGSQIALLVVGVVGLLYLILAATFVLHAPHSQPGPPAFEGIVTTARLVA
jgi:hypothetical protein